MGQVWRPKHINRTFQELVNLNSFRPDFSLVLYLSHPRGETNKILIAHSHRKGNLRRKPFDKDEEEGRMREKGKRKKCYKYGKDESRGEREKTRKETEARRELNKLRLLFFPTHILHSQIPLPSQCPRGILPSGVVEAESRPRKIFIPSRNPSFKYIYIFWSLFKLYFFIDNICVPFIVISLLLEFVLVIYFSILCSFCDRKLNFLNLT